MMSEPGEFQDPVRFVEAHARDVMQGVKTESDELPGALYHYTSGQGLIGILGSGELHSTNVLYMNDSSEMDYGRSLLNGVGDDLRPVVSAALRPFFDRLLKTLETPDFHYYVTCFCAKPDLLSQWRAYGAQAAGYSIGFDADDLHTVLPEYSQLVRVLYVPAEQHRAVRHALKAYLETAQQCCDAYADHQRLEDALTRWNGIASNALGRLVVRLKSEVFAEEHEWRAIIVRFSFDTAKVRFRLAANGIVVPYLPWLFKKEGVKAVRQVQHGPTVNSALAVRSLGQLLYNLGYNDVNVKGSAIPLRG